MNPVVGWLFVGFGIMDLLLAALLLVRPPASFRGRKAFPLALGLGGLLLAAVGAAFLAGILGAP